MYTIQRELGRLDNFKIALIGDLANGRTAHSLAYLLSKFQDVEMLFCSPENIRMKPDLKQYLTDVGVPWREEQDLAKVAAEVDVLYQTRIQKERFLVRPDPVSTAALGCDDVPCHCLCSTFLTRTKRASQPETHASIMGGPCDCINVCHRMHLKTIQCMAVQDRPELYDECKGKLIIDQAMLELLKPSAVLMHPLPRVDEITVEVDKDPRAAYFRQAANGLFVRMALLRLCLLGH